MILISKTPSAVYRCTQKSGTEILEKCLPHRKIILFIEVCPASVFWMTEDRDTLVRYDLSDRFNHQLRSECYRAKKNGMQIIIGENSRIGASEYRIGVCSCSAYVYRGADTVEISVIECPVYSVVAFVERGVSRVLIDGGSTDTLEKWCVIKRSIQSEKKVGIE